MKLSPRSRRIRVLLTIPAGGVAGVVVAVEPAWALPLGIALATAALLWDLLSR